MRILAIYEKLLRTEAKNIFSELVNIERNQLFRRLGSLYMDYKEFFIDSEVKDNLMAMQELDL